MRIGMLFPILFFCLILSGCNTQLPAWNKVEGAWKSRENSPLTGKPHTFTFSEKTATHDDDEIRNVTYADAGNGVIIVSIVGGKEKWCKITPGQEQDTLEIVQIGDKLIFTKTSLQEVERIRKMEVKDRRHEPL